MADTTCLGVLETRSFSFVGVAKNPSALRILFSKAWKKHCEDCGMPYNWGEFKDDLVIYKLPMNTVCRDGEEIYHA
jgi:hypothetical protein